ncbi:hypothetical protein BCV72DRAFT_244924 [Rhizopus microsporus var. microsporus]|uniref:Uncharacterized protein n=2 Tax=Rhizopus microsporus TaxID=58291 RepID=A0A2G4SIX8_RHIZD|nr:uncharacterized protein RHIMIDRAFT_241237 [Rhizopus microsporus ATCC 52813]ORE02774.1 hypothetical protein BCV72DRAFT_244924 [Rhizopus microsporus var. microsporus]PHZ08727.1 hypothetical protein RHIMIDRAFT_241237 [Rhizopus microsporus ATCC 52813]
MSFNQEIQRLELQIKEIKQEIQQEGDNVKEKTEQLNDLHKERQEKENLLNLEKKVQEMFDELYQKAERRMNLVEELESKGLLDESNRQDIVTELIKSKDDKIASLNKQIEDKQRDLQRLK